MLTYKKTPAQITHFIQNLKGEVDFLLEYRTGWGKIYIKLQCTHE